MSFNIGLKYKMMFKSSVYKFCLSFTFIQVFVETYMKVIDSRLLSVLNSLNKTRILEDKKFLQHKNSIIFDYV